MRINEQNTKNKLEELKKQFEIEEEKYLKIIENKKNETSKIDQEKQSIIEKSKSDVLIRLNQD